MEQLKKQSGASRIVEVLLGQVLLNCKVISVKSLIEKLTDITSGKIGVKKIDKLSKFGAKDVEPSSWMISLEIGNTKVITKFTLTANYFINKIEVSE